LRLTGALTARWQQLLLLLLLLAVTAAVSRLRHSTTTGSHAEQSKE
jgi:hypothetical protein